MNLERPFALALLAALPIAWWLHRARRGAPIVRVASLLAFRGAAEVSPSSAPRRAIDLRFLALCAGMALLAVAASGPSFGAARPDAFYVVLDVSASMSARTCDAASRAAELLGRAAPGAECRVHPLTGAEPAAVVRAGEALRLDARPEAADGLPGTLAPHLDAARREGFPGVVLVTDQAFAATPGVAVVGPSAGARANVAVVSAEIDGDVALVALRNFASRDAAVVAACGSVRRDVVVPGGGVATARFQPRDRGETATIEIVSPGDDLAADDRLVVTRAGGARRVRLRAEAACPRLEAALRASGAEIAGGGTADVIVEYRAAPGPGGDDGTPRFVIAPDAGSIAPGIDVEAARNVVVAGDSVVGRGAAGDVLPAPGSRLVAATRLTGGDTVWSDADGAIVVAGGTVWVVAADPEDSRSDWHRDPSFPTFVASALDALAGGPDRLVPQLAIPPSESDVVHDAPRTSDPEAIRAALRPESVAPDASRPARWLALAAAVLLAASATRRRG